MANFETPELKDYIEVPLPQIGVMEGNGPFRAKPEHQEALGFPGELIDDWENVAVNKLGDLVNRYRGLRVFLDSCVKCGACTDKCHYYLGTTDAKNMPVARQDLLRSVYRYYHTPAGKFLKKFGME
ncbi:MAG TPA: (Fe-S)-binding protein, partial [Gammaproteobacteria bacterium]|nr:(Fe-S)-binding protein [Gammaproteobacteria bacterium]